MSAPLFPLGRIVFTLGATDSATWDEIFELLARHVRGDWGCVAPEDAAANDRAVQVGLRILSAYAIDCDVETYGCGDRIWIVTEADRSVTTILLPSEY